MRRSPVPQQMTRRPVRSPNAIELRDDRGGLHRRRLR